MIISAAIPPRSCPRATSRPAKSSANVWPAIEQTSSWPSSKKLTARPPAHLDLHLILDNYATHKTPAVKRWLTRRKRFILHFTPTSCSWLNLVERLFAEITRQRIRRGVFHDVAELKAAIDEWIEHRNQDPKPFTWTATAKTILVKHRRAKKVLAKAGCK